MSALDLLVVESVDISPHDIPIAACAKTFACRGHEAADIFSSLPKRQDWKDSLFKTAI